MSKADSVFPRDTRSLKNISSLIQPGTRLAPGMDCAFLLSHPTRLIDEGRYFCYEFGRSMLTDTEALVRSVEVSTGLNGIRLSDWLGLEPKNADAVFWRQKAVVSSAQFILTDIYHLSINALNSGVPVYCLGQSSTEQSGTLGDFKKKVLFSMLSLEDHYFEVGAGEHPQYASVLSAIKHRPGRASQEWRGHFERIQEMKEGFRSVLLAAL